MTALVFDFGLRHIGVAVALRQGRFARGLAVVGARDGTPRWDALDALLAEWRPALLVVGEPLNMDGTASEMSARARRFGERLAARYGLAVEFADERLSTFEAVARGANAGRRRVDDSHALAAQVIAETWLNAAGSRESERSAAPSRR